MEGPWLHCMHAKLALCKTKKNTLFTNKRRINNIQSEAHGVPQTGRSFSMKKKFPSWFVP